ncbi:MAG: L,D-transpeptidase family protein [Chloroflexota bacterium]|nr:L,D-transpeptidase family protein [Chloroflexota bacterium]MBI5702268.1 L,D-transpeptidase family protein [Chloroflexota bacterium]
MKPARLFPRLILFLTFVGILLAAFWFAVPYVQAYFIPPSAPEQEYIWSYVEIPKPRRSSASTLPPGTVTEASPLITAQTPLPLPADTAAPLPTPTETPALLSMEVLPDTPTPQYVAPQPAAVSYGGSKYILVDISEQHMYVYEDGVLIYSFVVSTGINNATRVGTFAVQSKIPNAYGSTWDIWMPNWLGIYWAGGLENGIHALPILPNGATLWDGYLGRPVSYGCVVLGSYESKLLYDWAEIGTPVEIRW